MYSGAPTCYGLQVPAHSELCWLLNCCTPMGWMEKMIQYKEKAKKQVRALRQRRVARIHAPP